MRPFCKWSHSKGTGVPWLLCFFGLWWWLAYQPIPISKSYPLGTLCWVGPGFGERDGEESCITSSNTILTTLGFLATGSLHRELADRAVRNLRCAFPAVLNWIIRISARYIAYGFHVMPLTKQIKAQFAEIAGFPNVIWAIDCIHIDIKEPSEW